MKTNKKISSDQNLGFEQLSWPGWWGCFYILVLGKQQYLYWIGDLSLNRRSFAESAIFRLADAGLLGLGHEDDAR